MRALPIAVFLLLGVVATVALSNDSAIAQTKDFRGNPTSGNSSAPSGGPRQDGYRGGGGLGVVPGIITQSRPDSRDKTRGARERRSSSQQNATRQPPGGTPPPAEQRFVPDEVLTEVQNAITDQTLADFATRYRLTMLERQGFQFSGTTFVRWRITDQRPVDQVITQLESDPSFLSVQPQYLYSLQQVGVRGAREGDPMQYELDKLHLPQAHTIATGDKVLVAVVDTGVDASHSELTGSVIAAFDAIEFITGLNKHGTSIAGLIAAHKTLMGAAPKAQILSARVIGPTGFGGTFNILKGLDWAAANGARVINMSFAGPPDQATQRFMDSAYGKGIVLVACAGNAGPKSPPLYPAAYPTVIAVSATNARDALFELSNRGSHIAVAAPGADILVAIPNGAFELSSGTSLSAAEVTGVVALMLEQKPDLKPDQVRAILSSTARKLGPKGSNTLFGAGLVNAYAALLADTPPTAATDSQSSNRTDSGLH
jgi:subtilisin family serine protease